MEPVIRKSMHLLLSASFLLVGFPDQIARIIDHPIAQNIALATVAAIVFMLHLLGKNPLDRFLD